MRVALNEESQSRWRADDAERLRFEYDLSPSGLVIDIGAYRGEWAEQIHERYGCKIILIEPTPHILGCPYGQIINQAAAAHNGTMKFGGAYYYTSAHEDPVVEYECFDINPLLEKHEEIALVKINIEGGEYQLLPHVIEAGLHTRMRDIQVQFHEIENESFREWYEAIKSKLQETHRLTYRYPFCWENWRRKGLCS
jgi:FkbM family methyltransferase